MDHQAVSDFVQQHTRGAAQAYSGNLLGKVTGGSGGYYNLELPGGEVLRHVQNGVRGRWADDQAVTVQMVNGHYQIVAAGAAQGE